MTDYTQDPDAPPFLQEYEPPPRDALTTHDLRSLAARWITAELAHAAHLRRVDHNEGRQLVGRSGSGDFAGIAIPYYHPGTDHPHGWRLRRDKPDMEMKDGRLREVGKYMAAPGSGNMAYFPIGATPEMLADPQLSVVITEGEFKAMALWRLADGKFLPIGLAGVWNWRGTIGKVPGPNGERLNLKGVIPDIERVAWEGRRVIIAFDADAETNTSVAAGRRNLTNTLRERGALVAVVTWDVSRGKGIDDLLAAEGPAPVLEMFAAARYLGKETTPEGKAEAARSIAEETESILAGKDAMAAYSADFITKVACADDDLQFEVKQKLAKLKDFKPGEFNRRLKKTDRQINPPDPSRIPTGPDTATDPLHHLLNDHGNACRIRNLYGEDLRYCFDLKTWLVWDGMRWAVGDVGQARQLAKQAMLEFLTQAVLARNEPCERFARLSLNSKSVTAMLTMLESELPVRTKEFDTSPWLLNFINGTVDLRDGELRPHDRSDLITKMVHYRFDPEAVCPRWEDFLNWAMGTGPDLAEGQLDRVGRMVDYLQRAIGYSITGSTSEKAVFIPFGELGNNGKSTMLTVIRKIVEEYSALLQIDVLMTKDRSSSVLQEELAKLRGARFVQTSETEEGQKLPQGLLKRITQGMGDITVTCKYQHPITFPETHKLWLDTNHRPEIKDADDRATIKRLHPIPFLVEIEESLIDQELPAKLSAEAPGILAWMVRGAAMWHCDQSLNRPVEIDAAREEWSESSDQILAFLQERTKLTGGTEDEPEWVLDKSLECLSSDFYADYKRWCELSTERKIINHKDFARKLKSKGFTDRHAKKGTILSGGRPLSIPDDPED